jgi:hypothetical protein
MMSSENDVTWELSKLVAPCRLVAARVPFFRNTPSAGRNVIEDNHSPTTKKQRQAEQCRDEVNPRTLLR